MGIHPTRVLLYSSQASGTTHEGSDIVLEREQMPEGNKLLLQKGAPASPHPFKGKPVELPEWLREKPNIWLSQANQSSLFQLYCTKLPSMA
jgi:hypothetical protein